MIFIDTGAFLARHVLRDGNHPAASAAWERLGALGQRCFTSNFVLDESFTLLARRAGYPFAAERARNILSSAALTILRPGREEELAALSLFEKFADQEVSFTDCVSFALMRKGRIRRVFGFDRHFERAGFEVWP
ncbi:MAG: PIN domain-containing protein [Elusimicrobiota bacterium]